MSSGIPLKVVANLNDAKRWAAKLEYAPQILFSSIEKKLTEKQNPSQIANLIIVESWIENFSQSLFLAKENMDQNKRLSKKKKPQMYLSILEVFQKLQQNLSQIKSQQPTLHSHLLEKLESSNLPALKRQLEEKCLLSKQSKL